MLLKTYEKLKKLFQENHGYQTTSVLLRQGITTVQLKELLNTGKVERVAPGCYWWREDGAVKLPYYKFIEIHMVNPRAVICGASACYYHGLLKKEPDRVSVATLKTDRSGMKMNFPVERHYYSDLAFEEDRLDIELGYGSFSIYGMDRSVCDCIRFQDGYDENIVWEAVENYKGQKVQRLDRLLAYADQMRVGRIVRGYLL